MKQVRFELLQETETVGRDRRTALEEVTHEFLTPTQTEKAPQKIQMTEKLATQVKDMSNYANDVMVSITCA